ncbi:hypothetical protein MUK42_20141, partial [Musa troglodytarum]
AAGPADLVSSFGAGRALISGHRPWLHLLDATAPACPASAGLACFRLRRNIAYFRSNYTSSGSPSSPSPPLAPCLPVRLHRPHRRLVLPLLHPRPAGRPLRPPDHRRDHPRRALRGHDLRPHLLQCRIDSLRSHHDRDSDHLPACGVQGDGQSLSR